MKFTKLDLNLLKNYFLSGCILNFGVVPWFLSAAFLLCPIFFNLLLLLFLVTLVLETIYILRSLEIINRTLLPKISSSVKILLTLLVITFNLQANEIYMSIGEQKIIPISNFDKFIVGNKEVVSAKVITKRKLFIKANHLGISEIIILSENKTKSIKIHVINKISQEKFYILKEKISKINLQVLGTTNNIIVNGEINDMNQYNLMKDILKKTINIDTSKVNLTNKIKSNILEKIYIKLYSEFIDEFNCTFQNIYLNCKIGKKYKNNNEIKIINDNFLINFQYSDIYYQNKSFKITLQLIQVENNDGSQVNWGLSDINIPIEQIINNNIKNNVLKNIQFSGIKGSINIISKPSINVIEDEYASINLGSEIPFTSINKDGQSETKWKFIGFKFKTKISKKNNQFIIKYQTSLSKPLSNNQSTIGKQSAVSLIPLNSAQTLFEINYELNLIDRKLVPIIGEIPYLGKLFSSDNHTKTQKKLIGIIQIEENNANTNI